MRNIKIYVLITLKNYVQLLAIAVLNNTWFHFQKCLLNCENLINRILFYILNSSIYSIIIGELLSLFFGVLVLCVSSAFCYLASFCEYRLDNLRVFSISQLQAWECFQILQMVFVFYCIAPGFCSKQ